MENYKEKYEAALEAARKFKEGSPHLWEMETNPFRGVFKELEEIEDEMTRNEILNAVNEAEDSLYVVMTPQKKKRWVDWIERQNSRKVDEQGLLMVAGRTDDGWSEEDEKILSRLICVFNSYKNSQYKINRDKWEGLEINSVLYFLKSIKPQNHWKPSEEQLMGMETAINILTDKKFHIAANHLKSIYNRIKSL